LSLVGTTLSLTDGGSVVLIDNVNDADSDSTNEYLTSAVLNGTSLELTDGGGTTSVDLSSLAGPGGSDSIWVAAGGNAYLNPNIGNLGVGITNPAAQFTVGDTGNAAIMLGHAGNFNEIEAGRLIFTEDVLFNGTCGFEFKHNGAANEIRLVSGCPTLGDTSIIFTRTGEVKIPERLRIGDQMNPSADLHIKQSSAGNTPGGAGIRFEEPTTTDYWTVWNGGPFLSFGYNGTRMSYIDNTTGSYITTSDLRFKEQIRPVESVLPDVMKLRAVTYHYKSVATADRATGFIAQEVEKVFPELVVTDPTDGVKGISYSEFAVISIKAIQEQQVMIDKQQEEIELLKQAVKALQEAIEK
ncbi:MAG: tail fiber domain-containing protein, partial [Bacteroidia bacterium]|nr:tail fiber domain-containing protein [Bacteroidia bacterium]